MQKTALLVIDFINDIVHPQGKIAAAAEFVATQHVIEAANKAIAIARKKNDLILFVKVGFSANYIECPDTSPIFTKAKEIQALQLESWGAEFHEKLNITLEDKVIIKHRVSAFYATTLDAILSAKNITRLLITGVSTNMTVAGTSRDAHDRDYPVTILHDACGTTNAEIQKNTLELLSKIAEIKTVSDYAQANF